MTVFHKAFTLSSDLSTSLSTSFKTLGSWKLENKITDLLCIHFVVDKVLHTCQLCLPHFACLSDFRDGICLRSFSNKFTRSVRLVQNVIKDNAADSSNANSVFSFFLQEMSKLHKCHDFDLQQSQKLKPLDRLIFHLLTYQTFTF